MRGRGNQADELIAKLKEESYVPPEQLNEECRYE